MSLRFRLRDLLVLLLQVPRDDVQGGFLRFAVWTPGASLRKGLEIAARSRLVMASFPNSGARRGWGNGHEESESRQGAKCGKVGGADADNGCGPSVDAQRAAHRSRIRLKMGAPEAIAHNHRQVARRASLFLTEKATVLGSNAQG